MVSMLDVGDDDLERLSPEDAVRFFADLLWADSGARDIDAKIDIPFSTDARDGGIDATVRAPDGTAGPGVIGPGVTRYQIRSEKGLDPSAKSARNRLLFEPSTGRLRPRIKKCLDDGDVLVIVLFGTDAPDRQDDAEDLVKETLAGVDPSYRSARVEVWRQNRLIGHIGRYPALQRRLKGIAEAPFLDRRHWASTFTDLRQEFVQGPSQKRLVERARGALRRAGRPVDVRISGRPGSGKTRAAYEITGDPDLAGLVLYFENPSQVAHDNFLNRLLEDRDAKAILVVDECDGEAWRYLQARTEKTRGRIRLVTIYNKRDSRECHNLDDLGPSEIRKIIDGYGLGLSSDTADKLASLCTPSPRYAHWIAGAAASGRPEGMRGLVDEGGAIHERYIGSGLPPRDGERAKRKSVLMWFAVFARVGYRGLDSGEYEFLREECRRGSGIAPREFDRVVDDLRGLKILQGHKALYIAPHMLHIWLWREWWRIHGRGSAPEGLLPPGDDDSLPWGLKAAFREMLEENPGGETAGVARALLAEDGPFGDGAALEDDDGAETFRALACADPDSALRLLEKTVCTWDDRRLLALDGARRSIVWAVEHIAERSADLEAVARVLLRLASNENEQGLSNNATGVLARLFVVAPADLSCTPASVEDRLGLLARMLGHGDRRCRMLALAACDSALDSLHSSRIDVRQSRIIGLASSWRPSAAEVDAYRRAVSLLRGALERGDDGEKKAAAAIILRRAPELSRFRGLSGPIVAVLRAALAAGAADRDKAAEAVDMMLRVDGDRMGPDAAAACRRLASELAGGEYRSRMRRLLGTGLMHHPGRLCEGPGGAAGRSRALRDLAAESLRNRDALLEQSDWLFGPCAVRAREFGLELAAQDGRRELLPDLLAAMSGSGAELSDGLIGGYLEGLLPADRGLWESTLDEMERSERLAALVPAVTWHSEITARSWDRLVRMHGRGAAPRDAFAMFAYDGRACALSDAQFCDALRIVQGEGGPDAPGARAALALLSGRCECRDPELPIPAETARRVVLDGAFLEGPPGPNGTGMDGAGWSSVALRLVRDDPGCIPQMASAMLGSMGSDGGMLCGLYKGAFEALDAMAGAAPGPVWECAAERMSAPPDKRARRILEWACGRFPPARHGRRAARTALVDRVDPGRVWAWVDGDPGERAARLADLAPPEGLVGTGGIARGLLARYGADRRVRDALHGRLVDASRDGSGAEGLAAAGRACRSALASESDPNVGKWLAEHIEIVDGMEGRERALEERML